MSIDEKAYLKAVDVWAAIPDSWNRSLRAAIETYEAAKETHVQDLFAYQCTYWEN